MDGTFSKELAKQLGEGNSTPVDVVGVELVVHMINAFNRVVHRGARVLDQLLATLSSAGLLKIGNEKYIHPPCRGREMGVRSPTSEKAIVSHFLNHFLRQGLTPCG